MKVTVRQPTEIELVSLRMTLPVNYDEEDMPNDFPFRKNDMWTVWIDLDTGKIRDWPGPSHDLHMKVTDQGTYELFGKDGQRVAAIEQDYVPHGIVPGSYGDYVVLNIEEDGTITNWPRRLDATSFFDSDR